MYKILHPILVLLLIVLCGWKIIIPNEVSRASWLIGTWRMKTAKGNIYESWKKISKYELSGRSYMLKDKDTVTFETMKIVQESDRLFFVPTVKSQNQGLPVRFIIKSIVDKQLLFENPDHDFPQIISYRQISQDSLVASISGKQNGKYRNELFPMRRIK